MSELNLKRQRFVDEYLIDGNATQAAARSGYSKATAKEQGSRLLSFVAVKSQIAAKQAEIAAKKEVTLERLSDMFIADRELAREVKQMSAAVSATDKLARLHGHMIDRSERRTVTLDLSDDDLAEMVRTLQLQRQAPIELTAVNSVDTPVLPRAKRPGRKPLKRKRNPKSKR